MGRLSWMATLAALGCGEPMPTECRCAGDVNGTPIDVACGETFCAGDRAYECVDEGSAERRGTCDSDGGMILDDAGMDAAMSDAGPPISPAAGTWSGTTC